MDNLEKLLQKNKQWVKRITKNQADFFKNTQHQPNYLWIGCSDARLCANIITDMPLGEIFVYRNIANIAAEQDINFSAVLTYALQVLKITNIIVCGHYDCGGIKAAVAADNSSAPLNRYLAPIHNIAKRYADELSLISDETQRLNRLCELNVMTQVENIYQSAIVQATIKSTQALSIHGLVYNPSDGVIKDLFHKIA